MERLTLRAGIIDDHPAISAGVRQSLSALPFSLKCFECTSVNTLLTLGEDLDVVVLDLDLGDEGDPEHKVACLVERRWPVLLYTQERRPPVLARCLKAGALGVVDKQEPLKVLADAVVTVLSGKPFLNADLAAGLEALASAGNVPALSPREKEVLRLYAAGLPLKSVARRVGVSQDTAKEHIDRVRAKYVTAGRPAPTKTDLYLRAVEDGYLPPPSG